MMKKVLILILLLGCILLTGCTPEYDKEPGDATTFFVKEGQHHFKPYDWTWKNYTMIAIRWFFDESMEYDLGNNDQKDRNKLWGMSFSKFTNHNNSLMCDWNWSPEGQFWTVAPYYHKNNDTFHWPNEPDIDTIRLTRGEVFETHFNVESFGESGVATLTIVADHKTISFSKDFDIIIDKVRFIHPYFGGNQEAPQDMWMRAELIDKQ